MGENVSLLLHHSAVQFLPEKCSVRLGFTAAELGLVCKTRSWRYAERARSGCASKRTAFKEFCADSLMRCEHSPPCVLGVREAVLPCRLHHESHHHSVEGQAGGRSNFPLGGRVGMGLACRHCPDLRQEESLHSSTWGGLEEKGSVWQVCALQTQTPQVTESTAVRFTQTHGVSTSQEC